jgi:hypothetical protein
MKGVHLIDAQFQLLQSVIPAKAGIQRIKENWIPVFTGMTNRKLTLDYKESKSS